MLDPRRNQDEREDESSRQPPVWSGLGARGDRITEGFMEEVIQARRGVLQAHEVGRIPGRSNLPCEGMVMQAASGGLRGGPSPDEGGARPDEQRPRSGGVSWAGEPLGLDV